MSLLRLRKSYSRGLTLTAVLSVFASVFTSTVKAQTSAPTNFTGVSPSYSAPPDAIYASPTGTNSGAGTYASPLSLSAAAAVVTNGSTLVLKGGTYRGVTELGLSYNNLTVQNAPGETVWLTGDIDVSSGWVSETLTGGKVVWYKSGWTYSFPNNLAPIYIDPNYPAAGLRDLMTIDGQPLIQVTTKEALGSGKFFVDSVNQRLYLGELPSGDISATMSKRAISIWHGMSNGYPYSGNGTKIRGLNFRGFADEAILVGAPNVTIENCLSVRNGLQGISIAYNDRVNTGIVVRGSRFSSNGLKGIAAYRVNGLTVENCVIDNNNVEQFSKKHDAAGIKLVACRDTTFRENVVVDNYANGVWFDVSCLNTKAYYNDIRGNSKGFFFEISHNGWMAFNLIRDNDIGFSIAGSSNTRVYNNTLVANNVGIEVMDDGRINDTTLDSPLNQGGSLDGNPLEPGENDAEAAMGATWLCHSNTIRNNLIWESKGTGGTLYKADWTARSEATSVMVPTSDHNAFGAQNTSPSAFKWNLGSQTFRVYSTLASHRTANPTFEIDSMQKSVTGSKNPYFVNLANHDYRLHENSDAVNAGAALPSDIAYELDMATSPQHIGAMSAYYLPRVIETTQWAPAADAHVRDGIYNTTNYGTSAEMQVKRDVALDYSRDSLLRFDVANIEGEVQSVKLRLYGSLPSGTEAYVNALKVADDSWSETGVHWNNSPTAGTQITQTRVAGTSNQWYEWDVTAATIEAIQSDGLLSLKLQCDTTSIAMASFFTKENSNSANRPMLVVQSSVISRVSQTTQWAPAADAHVRDGIYNTTNYGTSAEMQVKRDVALDYSRDSLLRFDVANIEGEVQSVKLRLYGSLPSGTEAYVNALNVADDSWSETGVHWNNSPTAGTQIAQTRVAGTNNQWYEWDVTAATIEAIQGDGLLSLKLQCDTTSIAMASFFTKENSNSANRPMLVVQSLVPTPETTPPPSSWNGS